MHPLICNYVPLRFLLLLQLKTNLFFLSPPPKKKDFVKDLRMRPLNRHYFVVQTNPGEQFYLFTSLSAWLIRKSGAQFEQPQEFDDPNSTISNILENVRRIGVQIDFAPSKLKQVKADESVLRRGF